MDTLLSIYLVFMVSMDLRIKKIKIDTQIHTQKLIFFCFILKYLIRNLQEIRKILRPKLKTRILKKLKAQTQT